MSNLAKQSALFPTILGQDEISLHPLSNLALLAIINPLLNQNNQFEEQPSRPYKKMIYVIANITILN